MNTIFHIGWSKTGTSAFQKWLLQNEEELLQKGVLYPKTGRWAEGSHHELALSLRPIEGYQSKHDAQTLWGKLILEMLACQKNKDIHTVIITSELLPPIYEYPEILKLFDKVETSLSIMAVVREQISLLRSLQHQLVTDAAVHLTWNVWDLFEDHKENFLYYEKLSEYEQAFNWKEFNILPYDKRRIVGNLVKNIRWTAPVNDVHFENVSQPNNVVEVIRQLNEIEMPIESRINLNNKIKKIMNKMWAGSTNVEELSDEENRRMLEYYRDSNNKLYDVYGIKF